MVVAEPPPGMELRMTLEVELDERYITPAPPISWRTQTYSLAEVVGSLHLPQVVQCDVKDCPISVDNVNFDLKQPLLLCINRTVRKICARNLSVDKPVKALREVGEPVLIPEDYKGWFAVLKDRSRVPHFPSIAAIASSRVSRFLVTTKLVGFYILSDNQGVMTYVRRELLPGDVLRAGKVYVGSTKVGKDFALFKKKKKKEVEVKFLKCTDETDREILINLDQTGTFYPISYTNGSVTGCVMQLNQILKKLYFPLDVKLVYGRIPNAPCSFSGLLRLTTSFEENTVVASTIMNYKNILLELSTQSVLSFKVAHPTRQMLESTAYQQALEMCQERAEVYVRDMKVSFDFITEPLSSASSSSENVQNANKVSPVRSNTPLLPLNKTKTPKKSDSSSLNRAAQYGYIDTSGPLPPTASQSGSEDNSAEYEMIWLSSENKVKRRDKSTKDTGSESVEKRSSFRLSLEGTYLSCPIFTTDDRMKQGSVDGSSGSEPSSTTGSLEAPAEPDPPPLPPRAPRPKSKIVNSTGNKPKSQRDSIYEVLKKTQPVEQALQFVDKTSVKFSSTLSNSSSGSENSISDRTSTNYENSLTNTSVEENWLELNGLEDLRDYDFPEPYLLTKTSESDYSPIDDCPEMARMPGARTAPGTPPSPTDVVSYYDSGSYRTVRQTDDIDDLPLGASSSHVGSTSDTGATSGVTVATAGSAVLGGSGVADATSDGSAFRGPSALTGLSVVEVSEALRRLGLKDSVVDSFTNENIDGGLLTQFDELTLQETFPSLRSIDIRKICLFIQSGWQPNV